MRAPEFWNRGGALERLLAAGLSPAGWAYGATVAFKAGRARPYRSTAKVICVGNLTAGGTGKTPVALAIAKSLFARNMRPFFLTRGYGSAQRSARLVNPHSDDATSVGDEALLLATLAPTIVSRDRAAGAKVAERSGADVIVMDDGHQNFALAKDLSIVVVDAEQGFGNGRPIPAGPLREPVARGLARADAVVIVGEKHMQVSGLAKPVLRGRLVSREGEGFRGRRVVAFAGIGRPEKFFRTIRQSGADIVGTRSFSDHHRYSTRDLDALRALAEDKSAILVTTEKDFVRLAPDERRDVHYLPVAVIFEDEEALAKLLGRVAPAAVSP